MDPSYDPPSMALLLPAPTGEVTSPEYVHDLLDALLTGMPLNFGRHQVPHDVQDRLTVAREAGVLYDAPLVEEAS